MTKEYICCFCGQPNDNPFGYDLEHVHNPNTGETSCQPKERAMIEPNLYCCCGELFEGNSCPSCGRPGIDAGGGMTNLESQCNGRVYLVGASVDTQCSQKGNHYEQGKWWCHSHSPKRIAERTEKLYDIWDKQIKRADDLN